MVTICSVYNRPAQMRRRGEKDTDKMKAAFVRAPKIFAYLTIPFLGIGGGLLGWKIYRAVAFVLIGADAGLGIGFVIAIFILCLAETGENTKKTDDAAMSRAPTNASADTAQNSPQALKAYKDLLDQGIITQEEFEEKKKQILGL